MDQILFTTWYETRIKEQTLAAVCRGQGDPAGKGQMLQERRFFVTTAQRIGPSGASDGISLA